MPALQIVFEAMTSPEEAAAWSQSSVALVDAISGADAHVVGATKPLGGSNGPGKAFRSDQLLCCAVQYAMCLALACGWCVAFTSTCKLHAFCVPLSKSHSVNGYLQLPLHLLCLCERVQLFTAIHKHCVVTCVQVRIDARVLGGI